MLFLLISLLFGVSSARPNLNSVFPRNLSVSADPTCAHGVIDDATCCCASCGVCGGSGCGSEPGGADCCCQSHITRSCASNDPPCVITPSPPSPPAPTAPTAPPTFVHPGVVVDSARLDYIKANLDKEPFATAYSKAQSSRYANKDYTPKGPPQSGTIECGSYSHPNYGCSDEDSDGAAAYLQIILFSLTDDSVYASNAVSILNAYGSRLKKYNNSNGPLQAAWGMSKWARAAELAKHLPGVGWAAKDIKAFEGMVRGVVLPMIDKGSGANGNWELSMISGLMGAAVFLDDAALFDKAVTFWKERIPAYFYSEPLDGATHKPAPRGSPSWYGQTAFNTSTSGHCQETCRDEGHTGYGVAEAFVAAETAYIQGVDLYKDQIQRLPAALEYNARFAMGAMPPKYICAGNITAKELPTYEMGYNAYSLRLGVDMPNTLAYVQKVTRASGDPVDSHMMIYETLTHGGSPR